MAQLRPCLCSMDLSNLVYAQPGTYSVSLVVQDAVNCSSTNLHKWMWWPRPRRCSTLK